MLCSRPASNAGSLPGFLRSRLQKMPFEYNTARNFEFVCMTRSRLLTLFVATVAGFGLLTGCTTITNPIAVTFPRIYNGPAYKAQNACTGKVKVSLENRSIDVTDGAVHVRV